MSSDHLTVDEWGQTLGREIRDARLARRLDQRSLARTANVSIIALAGLDRGEGSSLSTLIAVVRWFGAYRPLADKPLTFDKAGGPRPAWQ